MFESPRLKASLNSVLQIIVTIYQGIAILGYIVRLVSCQQVAEIAVPGCVL